MKRFRRLLYDFRATIVVVIGIIAAIVLALAALVVALKQPQELTFEWSSLGNGATAVAALFVMLTFFVYWAQLGVMSEQLRSFESTERVKIFADFALRLEREDRLRKIIFRAGEENRLAIKEKAWFVDKKKLFSKNHLSPEEERQKKEFKLFVKAARAVCARFNLLGVLAEKNRIDVDLLLQEWHRNIRKLHCCLIGFIAWERDNRENQDLWNKFDDLNKRAEKVVAAGGRASRANM